MALSPTERTPIVIQPCLRSRIGLWEKYYYALFDITHCFSSDIWIYKYCCLVYRTVWCGDEIRSANCANTMDITDVKLLRSTNRMHLAIQNRAYYNTIMYTSYVRVCLYMCTLVAGTFFILLEQGGNLF